MTIKDTIKFTKILPNTQSLLTKILINIKYIKLSPLGYNFSTNYCYIYVRSHFIHTEMVSLVINQFILHNIGTDNDPKFLKY